eukprot:11142843-Alexandrium_andersonii.AAC.1
MLRSGRSAGAVLYASGCLLWSRCSAGAVLCAMPFYEALWVVVTGRDFLPNSCFGQCFVRFRGGDDFWPVVVTFVRR